MKRETFDQAGSQAATHAHGLPVAPLAMPRQVLEGRPLTQRLRRRVQRWLFVMRTERAGAGR